MPSSSTIVPRATMCGGSCASLIGSTGAKHTSVPSRISHHSSRVLVRKSSVNRLAARATPRARCGSRSRPGRSRRRWRNSAKNCGSIAPMRDALAVLGLVRVVVGRAGVEQVHAELLVPHATRAKPQIAAIRSAAPSTIAASITCPLPDDARLEDPAHDPEREEHPAAAVVADHVQRRRRLPARRGRSARARRRARCS